MRPSTSLRLGRIALVVLFLHAFGAAPHASAVQPAPDRAEVEPRVRDELARQGQTTFWVLLRQQADLRPAARISDWNARGRFVYERLTAVADQSQAGLRALLQKRGVSFQPFWVVNALRVTAGRAVLDELAAQPEVARILADRVYRIPEPRPGAQAAGIQAVEWNLDRIRAPLVWSTFGVRGEGIVVANIDTGVQFDHPALVRQYRGNLGNGSFDHNYHWHDPSNVCGSPSLVPCDNNGHGTHTMGTMVGDDGDPGLNQIGVAPRARWIAAKGCESSFCSLGALLSAGQWVLAPTDLSGQNPRPDLRPHVVNNSWGGGPGDPFYRSTVQAWVAAGIFPAFANGNSGPACGSAGSPGDYPESYGVGAHDRNNLIASFSSRGPSAFAGEIKPNLAAPGVDVRSSVPPNGYAVFSGTSMATPHVAGTVALLWSAAPALLGDVAQTRALLDQTVIDVADLGCGGTAADNNVWGEGRLDAFAAVEQAPRGPTGPLQGTVTDATSGATIAGAAVEAAGPVRRSTATDPAGQFSLRLPAGTYDLTIGAFGYLVQTVRGVVVSPDQTTIQNVALAPAPAHAVAGQVRDDQGAPIANATVVLLGTPLPPTTTDAAGNYRFPRVPEGSYDARAEAGRCNTPQTRALVVGPGDVVGFDLTLPQRADSFGYTCQVVPFAFIDAQTVLPLSGDDLSVPVALPFPFPFYGQAHTTAHVSTNGFLNFLGADAAFVNSGIPSLAPPNGAIYPFWDDLFVDAAASVRTQTLGTAPNRQFVIEWRNLHFFGDPTRRVRFEVVLQENGQILLQYADLATDGREQGNSATVGIENQAGTVAFQYAFNEPVLATGLAVRFRPGQAGSVQGRVTDANDGLGVGGATIRALQGGVEVARATTAADGAYRLDLRLGTYTIEASAPNYGTGTAEAALDGAGQVVVRDFSLTTARATVTPAALELLQRAGLSRSQALTIANLGSASLAWQLRESPEVAWLAAAPTSGSLPVGGRQAVTVTANSAGLVAGVYSATLLLESNSGRQPVVQVPVRLIVPAYDQPVNVGGAAYTDRAGNLWAADQAFNGSWGYTRATPTTSTAAPIAGTEDDRIYQDARLGRNEYRFERLPAGTYQVELHFAEIQGRLPGQRVFDVFVEALDRQSLTGHDVAAEVGANAADQHTLFVRVQDKLRVRLEVRTGEPIVSALRVTHRPDR